MSATMTEEYFGFSQAPFSLTPDPTFAFATESHERALRVILHGLNRHEGLMVVTGDIGCGKTTLCRRLLPMLPARSFLSLVLNPFLTADDLLRQVLEDFGLVSSEDLRRGPLTRASCHELARTLHDFLNSLEQIDGTAIIIVDEAQNLPLKTLEQIRLLSNFETNTRKLLQIILVGQKNLEPILELEELRQLNQRVSRRCRVEPLMEAELGAYINHRLEAAMPVGEPPQVSFTPAAVKTISALSEGVPRIVNLLCDRALEIGYAHGETSIDRRLALLAAKDLEMPVSPIARLEPFIRPAMGAAAAAAAVMIGVGVWSYTARGAQSAAAPVVHVEPKPPLQLEPALESSPARVAAVPTPIATSAPAPAVPAPAVAAAPTPATLEMGASYELTVASFATPGRASTVASDLVANGHPARVAASGKWQMVIVGPYTSEPEAQDARRTIEQAGFAGIRIARVP